MTSIPATQIPVGLPAEAEPSAPSDTDRPDEATTAEAASFAALLLQQSPPETPVRTESGLEPAAAVDAIDVVEAVTVPPTTLPETAAAVSPAVSPPVAAPQAESVTVAATLEADESVVTGPETSDRLIAVADTAGNEDVPTEPVAADPLGAEETSVPFAEELESFQQQETYRQQQLDDPDAESAEQLDQVQQADPPRRVLAESAPPAAISENPTPPAAVVPAVENNAAGPRRRPATDKLTATTPAPAAAESVGDQASVAVSLDAFSAESVTQPDTFAPEPVPVHGLQKIVNELIAEAETVVDNKTISVQFEEPHIGNVLIQMSDTDDGLTVSVAADDDLTLEMLNTGSQQLESTLKENNIELVEITSLPPDMNFQQNGQPDSPFQQQAPQIYRDNAQSGQSGTAPGAPMRRLTPTDQLDFRA